MMLTNKDWALKSSCFLYNSWNCVCKVCPLCWQQLLSDGICSDYPHKWLDYLCSTI